MLYIDRKVRQILGREIGQTLVEAALLMCFATVIFLAINWDGFRDSAGAAYQKMAGSMGTKLSQTEIADKYSHMSTSDLSQMDNSERIAADRATITALGEFLLTLNKSELKKLFATNSDALLEGRDSSKPLGVAVFDYNIVNAGDNGEALKIKLRGNQGGSISNRQTIQWMQGNFDTNTANYVKKDEYVSNRFFYSDAAIDPKPVADATGEQSATLRASFAFDSNGNVTSVTLNMTRSYQKNGKWERTTCDGLSNIVLSR